MAYVCELMKRFAEVVKYVVFLCCNNNHAEWASGRAATTTEESAAATAGEVSCPAPNFLWGSEEDVKLEFDVFDPILNCYQCLWIRLTWKIMFDKANHWTYILQTLSSLTHLRSVDDILGFSQTAIVILSLSLCWHFEIIVLTFFVMTFIFTSKHNYYILSNYMWIICVVIRSWWSALYQLFWLPWLVEVYKNTMP